MKFAPALGGDGKSQVVVQISICEAILFFFVEEGKLNFNSVTRYRDLSVIGPTALSSIEWGFPHALVLGDQHRNRRNIWVGGRTLIRVLISMHPREEGAAGRGR